MGIEMHFCHGHVIMTANSVHGKWKIATTPGRAVFFKRLADAKRWAKIHPKKESA